MKTWMRRSGWELLVAMLLTLLGIGTAAEEFAFRRGAERASATVWDWHPEKLFGFRGIARVEPDRESERSRELRWPVRTHQWFRPSPGDRVEVLWKPGAHHRLAAIWQGFGLSALLILGSIAWFMDVAAKMRQVRRGE